MIITLLFVMVAKEISLDGLTLQSLFQAYCNHPFWFIIALIEMIMYAKNEF